MDAKKGQSNPFPIFIASTVGLLIVGLIVAFALIFNAQAETQLTAMTDINTDSAVASLQASSDAIGMIPDWLPLVVLAVIMTAVLGIIIGIYLYVRNAGLIGGGA